MLTHKEVVINNVIIHAKRGKQLNEVRPIMTGRDKVGVLVPFKASCVYCCTTSDESVSDKPTFRFRNFRFISVLELIFEI